MRFLVAAGIQVLLATGTAQALQSTGKLGAAIAIRGKVSQESKCKGRTIDAVSLQDSSGSLYPAEWEQILISTTQLIGAIHIGKDNSRIAPISFGTWATIHWYLDDPKAYDADLAKAEVMNLPFLSEGTNTPQALTFAYDVFSQVRTTDPDRFSNKHLTRLLFIATDGCSNAYDAKYPSKEEHLKAALADLDKLENMIVLLVGIGTNLCVDEIRRIAGCQPLATNAPCPNAKFTDFEHIFDEIPKYLEEVCDAAEEWDGGGEENRSEGGSNAAAIAGGVLGGLALIGGIAGGAYAYANHGAGAPASTAGYDAEGQGRDEMLGEREEVVEAEGSMYAE